MSLEAEQVAEWAIECGLVPPSTAESAMAVLLAIAPQIKQLQSMATKHSAASVQLAALQRVCEHGWQRGDACRVCQGMHHHSDTCYVRTGTGYDLLAEHEATLRENDELRAALAKRLPVNGKKIMEGRTYRGLGKRIRDRFERRGGDAS